MHVPYISGIIIGYVSVSVLRLQLGPAVNTNYICMSVFLSVCLIYVWNPSINQVKHTVLEVFVMSQRALLPH